MMPARPPAGDIKTTGLRHTRRNDPHCEGRINPHNTLTPRRNKLIIITNTNGRRETARRRSGRCLSKHTNAGVGARHTRHPSFATSATRGAEARRAAPASLLAALCGSLVGAGGSLVLTSIRDCRVSCWSTSSPPALDMFPSALYHPPMGA